MTPFKPPLPTTQQPHLTWSNLTGSSAALAIIHAAQQHTYPILVITPDTQTLEQLADNLTFFNAEIPILNFPDWETLPYDHFSPHQDIISQRLLTLQKLGQLTQGIILVTINTLMNHLPPNTYLNSHSLALHVGQTLHTESFRHQLIRAGYRFINQVMEHGECAIRGSIIDLYPMGSTQPLRIDLFDQEIDSIRTFDPETQLSLEKTEQIQLLPAHEFPLTEEAITLFRQTWRQQFTGNPAQCPIYTAVSDGIPPAGIEYYLPFFFTETCQLLDYLPKQSIILRFAACVTQANQFWQEVKQRYDQLGHDITRPILQPQDIFWQPNQIFARCRQFQLIDLHTEAVKTATTHCNIQPMPDVTADFKAKQPLLKLKQWLDNSSQRVLLCAASTGRRELLRERLQQIHVNPAIIHSWHEFLTSDTTIGLMHGPLHVGLSLTDPALSIIVEAQLFPSQVVTTRTKKRRISDPDIIVNDLAELKPGTPVVHIEHGIGRYQGLQLITVDKQVSEFLTLHYANDDKIYVPVTSLHLISRYTGTNPEQAPLSRLGSGQWEKTKTKVKQQIHDVAVELLNIYAQRAARKGLQYEVSESEYKQFAADFPFEETLDQNKAISEIINDMTSAQPMDRLICGDVGFGKTEVAMRATFIAVQNNQQVAILVPTTLLAEQHYTNFSDRFADYPITIQLLSRFRSKKEQTQTLNDLATGKVDIVIGTHRLIQKDIQFKKLGLLIIDEEHRFGVRQKEYLKKWRTQIDMLSLTATPIPRTLNMAMADLYDISLITTPPARRLAIKTFWQHKNNSLVREALLREVMRGGQVFYLHNTIDTIPRETQWISELLPEAKVRCGHGQMKERELEQIMSDFYHQRFNVLVCTTIIETGIDIPTANTIIIDRADRFGLAQLHQLRGRVGRSHHQAYAYLLTPDKKSMTADAIKRLEAITALEDLGAGFTLASHDLEIRGAGELLGEEQSGNMQEIGFTLYMELLDQAIKTLQSGESPSLTPSCEIDLQINVIIPETYVADIHLRLVLYKRIANAASTEALQQLHAELIDRFGLLPESVNHLLQVTELKLTANELGIKRIDGSAAHITCTFIAKPNIDPTHLIQLVQQQPTTYQFVGEQKFRVNKTTQSAKERINLVKQFLSVLKRANL